MPVFASFDYAVVRVVPRVERGECMNVGVILYCAMRRYLGARIALDEERLQAFAPWLGVVELQTHLDIIPTVCAGDPAAGEIGRLPHGGRFHWLVAPRSTVVQTSPVHSGLCTDPEATLQHLVQTMVRLPS